MILGPPTYISPFPNNSSKNSECRQKIHTIHGIANRKYHALTWLPQEEKHREGRNSDNYALDLRFGKHEISREDKF